MSVKTWNLQQILEIRSDTNKYYYWLKHGKEAKSFDELFMFYNDSGGAKNFRETHTDPM